jgi:hypothetical protein
VTQLDASDMAAKEIRIGIRGEEQTRVIDKESKQAFDAVCILHEYSEPLPGNILQSRKLRTGSQTIPFQLPLEDGLPQTITIPWTHITYMILCWLEDEEGTKEEQTGVSVNILAKPMVCPYPSPFHMEPFVHFVKKNRLQRGHFVITLLVKDTIMELGGQVGVSLVIRNRSPLLIRRVKIALRQHVHATAVNHEREGERLLTFYEFQEFRKTKRMRSKWLRGVKPEEDFGEVLQELDAEEHQGTLRIPKVRSHFIYYVNVASNANISMEGNLKNRYYFLFHSLQPCPTRVNSLVSIIRCI